MDIPTGTNDRQTAFRGVTDKGIKWMIDPSCRLLIPDVLLEALLHPRSSGASRVIRENKVRRSMLIRVPQFRGAVFAKLYKKPAGSERLKYVLFPSKAAAEWKSMLQLYDRGLPVARPLARGEKRRFGFLQEAYLFSEGFEGSSTLSDIVPRHHSFAFRRGLTDKIAELVSAVHQRGFFFRDLHAGNLLFIQGGEETRSVYLADFHKVWRTGWVPLWMRVRDLAQLHNSLAVSRTIRLRFLRGYLRHAGHPAESIGHVAQRIDRRAKKMWITHLKSRTKRCLKDSSEFSIISKDGCTIFRRRLYEQSLIERLMSGYQQALPGGAPVILKKTEKETVSVVSVMGGGEACNVVIKESRFTTFFSSLRNSLFRSRARSSWIGTRALQVRGIATPDALALIEYRSGALLRRTLLLTGYVEQSHELNEYVLTHYNRTLSAAGLRHKRKFIAALAGFIREMHAKGVYHADLKSNNILVREAGDTWNLYVVDLDRIRCRTSLSFRERANNLAQINASVASCITPADRLLFFAYYAHGSDIAKERKKYFRRIIAIGKDKNTTPYGLTFKET